MKNLKIIINKPYTVYILKIEGSNKMDTNAIKIVKILGESNESWEDAVKNAVKQASKTIKEVTGVKVLDMSGNIKDGEIVEYKTTVEIAFPVLDRKK